MVRRMPRAVIRVLLVTSIGAAAGAALVILAYLARPAFVLDTIREIPSNTSGFHAIEQAGGESFVWTSDRAVIRLAGLDRRSAWSCRIQLRHGRASGDEAPEVSIVADGTSHVIAQAGSDFHEVVLDVAPRPARDGLTMTMTTTPAFRPGNGDDRVLGVQVRAWRCDPRDGWALAPARAMAAGAAGGAAFAATASMSGLPTFAAIVIAAIVALGEAVLLTTGAGAFGAYPMWLMRAAVAVAAGALVVMRAPVIWRRSALEGAARAAVMASGVILTLKIGALTHPAKALIDAVFQAHRLDWVIGGRYFFTQSMPSGVEFPYAIGLYVAAAPWASYVTDHVLLLRLVVLVAEAIAGLLLYALVVRAWGMRTAGFMAVVLFSVVPLPFVVIGNANLTNAFAQSVALMALAAFGTWDMARLRPRIVAGLTVLLALAFLSHVSTLVVLGILAVVIVAVLAIWGGKVSRPAWQMLLLAVLCASAISVGLYYRHFTEVYRAAFVRVLDTSAPSDQVTAAPDGREMPAVLTRQLAWHERAGEAAIGTVRAIGWPVLLLAMAGLWRLVKRERDRLSLLLFAWVAVWVALLVFGTMTRVETQYQRYAAEFLGRVNLAMYPAAVLLAAVGFEWAWDRQHARGWRIFAGVVAGAALVVGIDSWLDWIR